MSAQKLLLRYLQFYAGIPFFLLISFVASAQDIGTLTNQPLQISGGLRLSNSFYSSSGINPRRDAMQWRAIANLNLSYQGISAPFSLAFSDGNQEFNLPSYTFAGISPSYKWAKLHLGDRSLNYSKYTLNSLNFRGVGFELEPGKFYVSAMYGRLRRARAEDLNSLQALDPSYKRTGYGMKAGYKSEGSEYNLIYFGASDDETSILQPITSSLTPANNAVISALAKQKIIKNLTAEIEFAHSVFNADHRLEKLADDDTDTGNSMFGSFKPNQTIQDGNAYRGRLVYSPRGFSIQTGYEKIERGFRTMGALFFLSDAEYITAGLSKSFLENKLTLFANGGMERTNLDDFENNGTRRLVGAINLSYAPNESWIFSSAYSNFENTTRLRAFRDPSVIVDSILLAQVTQSANFLATHNLNPKGTNTSALTLVLSYQKAKSIIDEEVQADVGSRFFNGSLMYTFSQTEKDLRFTAAVNYNQTELSQFNNNTFSPTVGITKSFWDRKLQTLFRTSYNLVSQENGSTSNVLNLTFGASYFFLKDHSLSFNTSVINRSGSGEDIPDFTELYGRISYGYRFGGDIRFH